VVIQSLMADRTGLGGAEDDFSRVLLRDRRDLLSHDKTWDMILYKTSAMPSHMNIVLGVLLQQIHAFICIRAQTHPVSHTCNTDFGEDDFHHC
jgi:hypothetical protein